VDDHSSSLLAQGTKYFFDGGVLIIFFLNIMSLYYNSAGQLVQSSQVIPPYPHQPQATYANQQSMSVYPGQTAYPNEQAMSVYPGQTTYGGMQAGETQTGLAPYDGRNEYTSDQYAGPRRSPRLHTRPEATPPYRKKKSTTRKVVEGVIIGVAGTVLLSEIDKRNHKTPRSDSNTATGNINSNSGGYNSGGDNSGGNSNDRGNHKGIGLNEVVEGGLAAGAVALALYEKNRKKGQAPAGSIQPQNASLEDPRVKTLVEGALATAAAVALAFHENSKSGETGPGHTV
jgi:hypothetical protein